MGMAMMEEIVSSVGAILKTLECPICFDLLKVPVSAGCGHFFCQHCVSGILQSNYRAPCPLCKRSFTRRSVQTATQRNSVISAARALAETCNSLTGAKFNGIDSFIKEGRKSTDVNTLIPAKKFRSSNEKGENTSSRKRKSVESEDSEVAVTELVSKGDKDKNVEASSDDELSKKRMCPNADEYDSDDELPTLDDIINQSRLMSKSSTASNIDKNLEEKPSSFFPTDKWSGLKTYSSLRKKEISEPSKVFINVDSEADENEVEYSTSNNKSTSSKTRKESSADNAKSTVSTKNKLNALKNKTNEVQPNQTQCCIVMLKPTDVVKPSEKSEAIVKSKENKINPDASVPPSIVPQNQPCPKNQKRGRRKGSSRLCNSPASKNKETEGENVSVSSENKDSYTLSEVSLSTSFCEDQNEQVTEKNVEDPFKSMGLTDTAVSVNPVLSPLAAKTLSMLKSPGWSRVKEVKREFKVKKFKSLHVEKNSSTISSLKNSLASDSAEEKNEQPMDITENKIDLAQENLPNFTNSLRVDLEKEKERQPENVRELSNESRPAECEQICQAEKEVVNLENELESHTIVEEDYNTPDECNDNYLKEHVHTKALQAATTEGSVTTAKLPTVSITSNSVICANYTNAKDKISKQNVVKTKIVCEIPNNSTLTNDLNGQNNSLISKYIQDNCPEANVLLNNNPADMKQGTFPLSSQISGYQTIRSHSILNEDDGFQYVEQSQQTSQMFNFDLPNPEYNRWNSLAQPCILPKQANRERTKVLKRTCLTLEEIQDGFFKSQESNQPETLCSVPFMDGQFKLHINVSDDTLNVSVLKVMDEDNNVSVPLNKYIQTSNNLFLPSILPSSNAGSESSLPDSASNPFPNLNKASTVKVSDHAEYAVQQNESSCKVRNSAVAPSETDFQCDVPQPPINDYNKQCDYEDQGNENDMEMSEIIHFPPETSDEKDKLEDKPYKLSNEEKNFENVDKSLKNDTAKTLPQKSNCTSLENDPYFRQNINMEINKAINLESEEFSFSDKEEKLEKPQKTNQMSDFQNRNLNTFPSEEIQNMQIDLDGFSDSDKEEKIEQSTKNNQISLKSDLPEKEENLEKSQKTNQMSDFHNTNSNILPSEGSQNMQIDLDGFSDSDKEEKIEQSTKKNQVSIKSDLPENNFKNLSFKERKVLEVDSDGFSDSDQEEKLGKSLETNQISLKSELLKKHFNSLPSEKSRVEQLDSDEFSNSDQDEPLKILEKCFNQGSKDKRKKISRLSLKKKATSRKSRILDSTDESDDESNQKSRKENDDKVSQLLEKTSKTLSPIKSLDTLVQSDKIADLKNSANQSVAGETLSALTSEYSEDIQETNASGIILEIKDLAEKIKSLEGKLKQCGYSDLQTVSQLDLSKHERSNDQHDSEDSSSDLFPQSVPPTPPKRV